MFVSCLDNSERTVSQILKNVFLETWKFWYHVSLGRFPASNSSNMNWSLWRTQTRFSGPAGSGFCNFCVSFLCSMYAINAINVRILRFLSVRYLRIRFAWWFRVLIAWMAAIAFRKNRTVFLSTTYRLSITNTMKFTLFAYIRFD